MIFIGYKEDTYQQKGKVECETHYKTVYKTVIETKNIKKCEDVPEQVCNYIKEKVYYLQLANFHVNLNAFFALAWYTDN